MRVRFHQTPDMQRYLTPDVRVSAEGEVVDVPAARAEHLLQTFPRNFHKAVEPPSSRRIYPRHFATRLKPSLKEKRGKGKLSFTYFYAVGGGSSFALVAKNQVRALRSLGYRVEERNLNKITSSSSYQNHFAIVHPLMFTLSVRSIDQSRVIGSLSSSFRYLVGFDVADTSHVNGAFVDSFNDERINGICVPSTFSYYAYKQSGILNRVFVIPHGVNKNFKPQNVPHSKPRVLGFLIHSGTRKGADVFQAIVSKFPKVQFVVKGNPPRKLEQMDNVQVVKERLPEKELVRLYNSCDVLLYPYRSGSWELPVLEAQACGLPVVATGWGCILDYANLHNAYLSNIAGYTTIFNKDYMHNGFGAEPDTDDLCRLLEFVLNNLKECKEKAKQVSASVRKTFTWERSARLLVDACKQIMEED